MFPALLDLGFEVFYNRFEFAQHCVPKSDLVLEMGNIREAGLKLGQNLLIENAEISGMLFLLALILIREVLKAKL
jgi:hypothetical protein